MPTNGEREPISFHRRDFLRKTGTCCGLVGLFLTLDRLGLLTDYIRKPDDRLHPYFYELLSKLNVTQFGDIIPKHRIDTIKDLETVMNNPDVFSYLEVDLRTRQDSAQSPTEKIAVSSHSSRPVDLNQAPALTSILDNITSPVILQLDVKEDSVWPQLMKMARDNLFPPHIFLTINYSYSSSGYPNHASALALSKMLTTGQLIFSPNFPNSDFYYRPGSILSVLGEIWENNHPILLPVEVNLLLQNVNWFEQLHRYYGAVIHVWSNQPNPETAQLLDRIKPKIAAYTIFDTYSDRPYG